MQRKADISIQFNWVFVLVAGVVLFGFFVGITRWQTVNANEERDATTLRHLDHLLHRVEQSVVNVDAAKTAFSLTPNSFTLRCDEVEEARIAGTRFAIPLDAHLVFSPDLLEGGKLWVWTMNWEVPFKVAPFVVLDDGRTAYVFITDSDRGEELERVMEGFALNNTQYGTAYSDRATVPGGYAHYRFVFFDTAHTIEDLADPGDQFGSFSAVHIQPDEDSSFEGVGTVTFFRQNGGNFEKTQRLPFLKKEAVYGAITSADADWYGCTLKKALRRLRWVTEANLYKARLLEQEASSLPSCKSYYYTLPLTYLAQINQTLFSLDALRKTEEASINLDNVNEDLTQKSCPVVY